MQAGPIERMRGCALLDQVISYDDFVDEQTAAQSTRSRSDNSIALSTTEGIDSTHDRMKAAVGELKKRGYCLTLFHFVFLGREAVAVECG